MSLSEKRCKGEPAPADGSLPAAALAELAGSGLSWYLHVPFCRSRCGYCDFNTYTAAELGGASRCVAFPERHPAGFARCGRHDNPVMRDLVDAPRSCAEDNGLAGAALEDRDRAA